MTGPLAEGGGRAGFLVGPLIAALAIAATAVATGQAAAAEPRVPGPPGSTAA